MNDKKHNSLADGSQGYPPILVFGELLALGQGTRIIENKNRSLKADIMLEQVLSILVPVPFKTHVLRRAYHDNNRR